MGVRCVAIYIMNVHVVDTRGHREARYLTAFLHVLHCYMYDLAILLQTETNGNSMNPARLASTRACVNG
jgi:hypothetical protein